MKTLLYSRPNLLMFCIQLLKIYLIHFRKSQKVLNHSTLLQYRKEYIKERTVEMQKLINQVCPRVETPGGPYIYVLLYIEQSSLWTTIPGSGMTFPRRTVLELWIQIH